MEDLQFPTTARELARSFGAEVLGDGDAEIHGLAPLSTAKAGSLSFFSDRKFADQLGRIEGAVLFASEELARTDLPLTYILVADPKLAFAEVAKRFRSQGSWKGISPLASVDPSAQLAAGVNVGPFAYIGEGARVGTGTTIYPHAFLGRGVVIGDGCEVHPHVVIMERVVVGNRVKIFSGAVIGSDGFGFLPGTDDSGYVEMPQIGTVVIEDDVRIGAKCTVDRATLGETLIQRGTKLDDQVHVGHNCVVGKNVILCAQVGLGGSAVIEQDAILGGQVGIGHGVTVGKAARMGGQSGTSTNLKGGETYFMTPALRMAETVKVVKYLRRLPKIWDRLSNVEKQLASLLGAPTKGNSES